MFELHKYEKQVETNISICFILMLMSGYSSSVDRTDSLCDTVRPIGLLSLLVQEKRRIFICAVVDSLSALLVYIYLLDCS